MSTDKQSPSNGYRKPRFSLEKVRKITLGFRNWSLSFSFGVVVAAFMNIGLQNSYEMMYWGLISICVLFFGFLHDVYIEHKGFLNKYIGHKSCIFIFILYALVVASSIFVFNSQTGSIWFELNALKKEGTELLTYCSNENGDGNINDFNTRRDKWFDDMSGFIWSDAIRNDDEFKHWKGPNRENPIGDDYFGGVGFYQERVWSLLRQNPIPSTHCLDTGQYETVAQKLTRIDYYLDELKRRILKKKPRSPDQWKDNQEP